MERLRRKFFKSKLKSVKPPTNGSYRKSDDDEDEDQIYLEAKNDEISTITSHLDPIAEELLSIAKKSSHTIRLSKLHDDLLRLKALITRKLSGNAKELYTAKKQVSTLKRHIGKAPVDSDVEPESSLNTRYNRSFASDRSMADTTSHHSLWSPNTSILSSSITTPIFRRRLAETAVSEINHSAVVQEHFVYLYQQLCANCSKCSCYQSFIRNQVELEYLSICSYNEQLKGENDLLQRLLADCKHSYEQQYVLFNQYEQYLIEYEQCIQAQYELIRALHQCIDRFQTPFGKRTHVADTHEQRSFRKVTEYGGGGRSHDVENSEIYRMISVLHEQCQRHVSQLPKRAQLFSYTQEQFHPPPHISGVVDVADLEVSILFVDLLTLKHENNELRWANDRLLREKKVYKSKTAVLELTNKYLDANNGDEASTDDSLNELAKREKTLRLYVYRLYDLLQTTTKQLEEQQTYYETLLHQFKIRHRELIDQVRQSEQNRHQ